MIYYTVRASRPQAHHFEIQMTIPHPLPQGQTVSMPRWIPGSYLIRDFARHIMSIQAFVKQGKQVLPIKITKINGNTWECEKSSGPLIIEYTVYANDLSVRGAYIDATRGFFNGSALFLEAHSQTDPACKVEILPPECEGATHWQVATTLTREGAAPWGFGQYSAASYDELIDHPVTLGTFAIECFEVKNVPHQIVVSGRHTGDLTRLAHDVKKICQAHMDFFEGPAPFSHYLFHLQVTKEGYGGLEHRCSSALLIQREALPRPEIPVIKGDYLSLLGLFSHEYFHAWNVKRIKPLGFVPYELDKECYTRQLWAFEGITSYYDDLALVRAKLITVEQYWDLLAQNLTRLARNGGRKKQNVLEASFDAWTKFYQPNENSQNATVSYYLKGMMIAWAIDLEMRAISDNERSLDHVMKQLWQQYGQEQGVPELAIEQMIEAIGGPSVTVILKEALYTTQDLPIATLLTPFGLEIKWRIAQGSDDMGGKRSDLPIERNFNVGSFGWSVVRNQERLLVASVNEEGAAQEAGISANDEITALDGIRVDAFTFEKYSKNFKEGQKIKVHLFSQDLLKEVTVILKATPLDTAEIVIKKDLTQRQKANLDHWLTGISQEA